MIILMIKYDSLLALMKIEPPPKKICLSERTERARKVQKKLNSFKKIEEPKLALNYTRATKLQTIGDA